jgi:hypothetical protein
MNNIVYLSKLENIAILWHGALYALALFLLRSFDATDKEFNARYTGSIRKSRPTIHGLAADFSMLTKVPKFIVENKIKALGLNLGATVEFDSDFPV